MPLKTYRLRPELRCTVALMAPERRRRRRSHVPAREVLLRSPGRASAALPPVRLDRALSGNWVWYCAINAGDAVRLNAYSTTSSSLLAQSSTPSAADFQFDRHQATRSALLRSPA